PVAQALEHPYPNPEAASLGPKVPSCKAANQILIAGGVKMSLFAGKTDAISETEKGEKERPSIIATKAIAEEGLIYGLPLVMYYTSAYELFVDKTSSQYKASIGTLTNEARVFTYEDT